MERRSENIVPGTMAESLFLTAMPCCSTVALTVLLMTVAVSLLLSTKMPFANAELTVLPSMMALLTFVSRMPCAPSWCSVRCCRELRAVVCADFDCRVLGHGGYAVLRVSVALELPSSMRCH